YHPFSLLSVPLVISASTARRMGSGNAGQASITRLRLRSVMALPDRLFSAKVYEPGTNRSVTGGFSKEFEQASADCKSAIPGSNPGGASAFFALAFDAIWCNLVQTGTASRTPWRSCGESGRRVSLLIGAIRCNLQRF